MPKVKDIMRKKVITVTKDTSVEETCNLLVKNKLSGVPVVDKNRKLVGYISEKDIIRSFGKKPLAKKVEQIMNRAVFSIDEDLTVSRVSRIFSQKGYRRLPVVKRGKLVGIVSRKDVINRILNYYY